MYNVQQQIDYLRCDAAWQLRQGWRLGRSIRTVINGHIAVGFEMHRAGESKTIANYRDVNTAAIVTVQYSEVSNAKSISGDRSLVLLS